MFALWGDDLSTALHSPDLRATLAAAGVERLQVNIDDADVAPAMRIATDDSSIGAIVSVWTSGPADVVTAALQAVAQDVSGRVAGWEVEERRPIEPPESWDGSRGDGLANIALLRRPDELTQDEWLHRWLVDHTPVAIETQATFGYVQNVVVAAVTPEAPAKHALVEELFPIVAVSDMHAFYGSGGDDAELSRRLERMMGSVTRFGADRDIDLVPTSRYLYDLRG